MVQAIIAVVLATLVALLGYMLLSRNYFYDFWLFVLCFVIAKCQFSLLKVSSLSANFTKWPNTLKQFVGNLRVFGHFVGLALKGLTYFVPMLHEYKIFFEIFQCYIFQSFEIFQS